MRRKFSTNVLGIGLLSESPMVPRPSIALAEGRNGLNVTMQAKIGMKGENAGD